MVELVKEKRALKKVAISSKKLSIKGNIIF